VCRRKGNNQERAERPGLVQMGGGGTGCLDRERKGSAAADLDKMLGRD
jgi:hypothetical protein